MMPRSVGLWALVLLACHHVVIHAAHSRRRQVVRREAEPRYDRSITTFSADGRLKQVEYGMEASQRGQTLAAFCSDTAAVVAISSSRVYRIDAHVYLFTSGLVGDGRVLASTLKVKCQNFRLSYGEAPTIKQVSRMAAELQHDLTRIGGARPLGCTAVVVGVSSASPQLFQTDPGGIVEQCRYCAAGKGRDKAMESLRDFEEGSINDEEILELGNLAEKVATAALKVSNDDEEETTNNVDVWIVRPNEIYRGETHTICIKNVTAMDTEKLRKHFSITLDPS